MGSEMCIRDSVSADNLPVLMERTADMVVRRNQYAEDWFTAMMHLTRINASSSKGSLIDVEQNARLGRVLGVIEGRDA